jgi:uracil-DNA glycosylase
MEAHNRAVVACTRCARLRAWCARVAGEPRRAYAGQTYWGRPVPTWLPAGGAQDVRLWIIGLAPAAHGANRTGRLFTGDRSGDFLFAALHRAGFASGPVSRARDDGTELLQCAISAVVRCAPPQNRPTPRELLHCRGWLDSEWQLLPRTEAVLALGGLAFDQAVALYRRHGLLTGGPRPRFAHGLLLRPELDALRPERDAGGRRAPCLLASFHVSQQNTFTGRLTPPMLDSVLDQARRILHSV